MSYYGRKDSEQVIGSGAWVIITILVLAIIALLMSWVFGWISLVPDKTSRENVEAQWGWAYGAITDLEAAGEQVCSVEVTLRNEDLSAAERTTYRATLLTYEQNYSRLAGDYNEKVRNAFEAGIIRPNDVPDRAPTLTEMKAMRCGP